MNRIRYLIAAALFVCCVAIPGVSFALPEVARAIIYFDANDNIIGNQNLYCNNVREHIGNIDPANVNRIEFEFGCGDPIVSCTDMGLCNTVGHNVYTSIVYFRSATGRTVNNYCLDATYIGGPFYRRPDCSLPAPSEIPSWGSSYLPGWD